MKKSALLDAGGRETVKSLDQTDLGASTVATNNVWPSVWSEKVRFYDINNLNRLS